VWDDGSAGNYRSLSEIVTGTLSTDFNVHGMPVKLPSGDEALVDFSPVSWADAGNKKKAIWKVRARLELLHS
jgi:hypothetical protein